MTLMRAWRWLDEDATGGRWFWSVVALVAVVVFVARWIG